MDIQDVQGDSEYLVTDENPSDLINDGEITVEEEGGVSRLAAHPDEQDGKTYYVLPEPWGKDSNTGESWETGISLTKAAQIAQPGDTFIVFPGVYWGDVSVVSSGEPDKPIVFKSVCVHKKEHGHYKTYWSVKIVGDVTIRPQVFFYNTVVFGRFKVKAK